MKIKIVDIKITTKDANTKRFRTKYGSLSELANSIFNTGLLHPIVVDELKDDPKHKWFLIAGDRRVKAHIMNGMTEIEATLKSDLTDVQRKTMEIEENIFRKKLEWPEYCEAVSQLNKLKKLEFGETSKSKTAEQGWSMQDMADSLGASKGMVSQDIKLAKDIKANPEFLKKVAKLPKTAARKIVNQLLETKSLKKQLKSKKISISSDIRLGSCVELIDDLADDSINMLFTDPPFAVQEILNVANSKGAMTYNVTASNVSTPDTMLAIYDKLIPKLFKKLKPGAHIYMMLGMGWYTYLIDKLREVGFLMDDLPIIWNKGRPSIMAKDMHYMSCYQAVLFGFKPPASNPLRHPTKNVLDIPTISPQARIHGLQLPFDLLKIFIENSTSPGETVLDCFAGSGATVNAAKRLGRSAIAFELDEGNYLRAQKFISGD